MSRVAELESALEAAQGEASQLADVREALERAQSEADRVYELMAALEVAEADAARVPKLQATLAAAKGEAAQLREALEAASTDAPRVFEMQVGLACVLSGHARSMFVWHEDSRLIMLADGGYVLVKAPANKCARKLTKWVPLDVSSPGSVGRVQCKPLPAGGAGHGTGRGLTCA